MAMEFLEEILGWMGKSGPEQWTAIGSALVAAVSFFFNWRMVQKQETRANAQLKQAHDSDLIRWSDEVIGVLAEAYEMLREKGKSYPDAEFVVRRVAKRAHLSALIDRGRLFFPNRMDGKKGLDKDVAFQGSRQPALDALVDAYDLLGVAGDTPGPEAARAEEFLQQRRRFVSEVFKAVDPVRRGMTLKELRA
jgi:hypothetical protein